VLSLNVPKVKLV